MSCYSYIDQYADEDEDNKKEEILQEAIGCFQQQEEERTNDLQEFINDFINSKEYSDYVQAKKKIMKRSVATQCAEDDIIVEVTQKSLTEKYPLTEQTKKMYAFKDQFEKYAENLSKIKIRRKQERGIQAIKEKINAAKLFFEFTKETTQRDQEKSDDKILHFYSSILGFNLSEFHLKPRSKILERIKTNHRVIAARGEKRKQNVLNIIQKLLFDYKVKKDVIKFQNKTYDYKVKRKEKIIRNMEVVGTKIELIDRSKTIIESPKTENVETPQSVVEKDDKKIEKSNKGKKDKKEKQEKSKQKKVPKERKEKGKKKEKPEAKLVLPFIPVVNPREKIVSEGMDQMLDMVEEFRNLDSDLEDRNMTEEKIQLVGEDTGLSSKPADIVFRNYDEGKIYYKTVVLCNVSTQIRKVRFLKFSFQNQYDEISFDVENFGIQKVFVGCRLKFQINFQPHDSLKSYEGKMVFLSYDVRSCDYFQFTLDVKCIPRYSNLQIYPKTINFGRMTIWKAKEKMISKVFNVQNEGAKACTIYIHKIPDPLDIQSILDEDDDKENMAPQPEYSNASLKDVQCIEDIKNACIDNVFNNFYFEQSFLMLNGFEERRIRVFFKNADYVGHYLEKFTVDVYEKLDSGDMELVGCEEITLLAETTGHFISTKPAILDLGVCNINSCYQLNFEAFNNSSTTQAVSMRFPSSMADLVHTDNSTVYLPSQGKITMWFKFIPREYVFKDSCIHFDKCTSILEFPIRLYLISKQFQDYPPIKLRAYAILANIGDITIMTAPNSSVSNFLDTILLDMSTCSIYETIWTEISLMNNSAATQVCGFLDLPECVTIEPNRGFVRLHPNQQKKFILYFSPDVRDFSSYPVGSLRNNKYFFKLKVDTVSSIGRIKKDTDVKPVSSIDLMKLSKKEESQETSMFGLMDQLKRGFSHDIMSHSMVNKAGPINAPATTSVELIGSIDPLSNFGVRALDDVKSTEENIRSFDDTVLNYQNFVILETNSRKDIWCKVSLKRPLLEFSHQAVEFPDTPCGSYSIMQIRLTAIDKEMEVNCDLPKKKKPAKLDYTATFQISGNSEEITVEPQCGTLRAGESVKITLLAKPNVPQKIIEQTAKSTKYSEIYEMKLKEFQASRAKKRDKAGQGKKEKEKNTKNKSRESAGAKKGAKEKKNDTDKKKDAKKTKETEDGVELATDKEPTIVITDKELEYGFLDLYPAEMVYWRSMESYYIKANFTCCITYEEGLKIHKKPDWIYLDAVCKVTRPNFITSLNLQRIDFGKCVIGMSATKEIMFQNIKYDDIDMTSTILNPLGCFFAPFVRDLKVPPEHGLKLPINFSPVATNKVLEYMEVRSDATVLPLILCGEGVLPVVKITPDFTIFRLETKQSQLAELHLKIENAAESEVIIRVEKLFEIEGQIVDVVTQKQSDTQNKDDTKTPKNKKEQKPKGKKIHEKEKVPKYSDSLTDGEVEAIGVHFKKLQGNSHFDLSHTEKSLHIQPNTNHNLTIFFGEPEMLTKRKMEKPKTDKKEKGKVKEKKSEESGGTKKNGESKINIDSGKQYITQYNIFVGKIYFKSVVLICKTL